VERRAIFERVDKGPAGLHLRRSDDGSRSLEIRCHAGGVSVFGTHVPARPEGANKSITVYVFLDKSIIEVYVGGGKETVARVMYPPLEDQGIKVFTADKAFVDIWQMNSIWKGRQ